MNLGSYSEDILIQQTTAEYLVQQLNLESTYAKHNKEFWLSGLPAVMWESDLGIKSLPRNPLLFGIFHRMDLVEKIGSGIKRIRQMCRDYEVAEPVFEVSEDWVTTTFNRQTGQVAGEVTSEILPQPESRPESQPESLGVRILSLLSNGPLPKSELSSGLGQKEVSGQLNKVIRLLLANEAIEYTIPEKPRSRLQQYRLAPKGKNLLGKWGKFEG